MEAIPPQVYTQASSYITEIGAFGTILVCFGFAVVKGFPMFIRYLEKRDAAFLEYIKERDAIHREDIKHYFAESRREREAFVSACNRVSGVDGNFASPNCTLRDRQ